MKKIAMMMYRMDCGGVERALIDLLGRIDPERYAVDLYLLEPAGDFLTMVPGYVNILTLPVSNVERELIKTVAIRPTLRYAAASGGLLQGVKVLLRYIRHKLQKTPLPAYAAAMDGMPVLECDIALDFLGYASAATYMLAQKMNAKKKYTWIHGESCLRDLAGIWAYLRKFQRIFCVSRDLCEKVSQRLSESPEGQIAPFKNFIDDQKILTRGANGPALPPKAGIKLLTVGRMAYEKGYGLAVDAAAQLKQQGIGFHWFFCGEGPLRPQVEEQIAQLGLQEDITVLGFCENPYSYMKDCDIYVQTSISEGYGLTIAEAALLGCPIVSTAVPGAKEEIAPGVNGVITDIDAKAIATGIARLAENPQLLQAMKERTVDHSRVNAQSMEMLNRILTL